MASFQIKVDDFIKTVDEVNKNTSLPKWVKPFLLSVKTFAHDLKEHLNEVESTTAILKHVTDSLSTDRDKIMTNIKDLEEDIKELEEELDDLQQYSRRTCLLIHGVKEERNEDIETAVKEVIDTKLQVGFDDKDIARTHRLGRKKDDNSKPRPIIVRFLSYRQRKKAFDAKKKLKGQKIVITENLTKKRYLLLQRCVQEFERKNFRLMDAFI